MLRIVTCLLLASIVWCDCIDDATCKRQLDQVIEDIRERITDRLQQETEDNLGIAPTVINVTALSFHDGMMETDMTNSSYENALLEHFWRQLFSYTAVDWIYYGDEVTGKFIGFRRVYKCEVDVTYCGYDTGVVPQAGFAGAQANSLVRLYTTGGQLQAWTTVEATGSNLVNHIYTDPTFNTKTRGWYTNGKNLTTTKESVWTQPYLFTGGRVGVTVSRKVEVPTGNFIGVVAADYELDFLSQFIGEIPVRGNSTIFIMASNKDLLATNLNINIVTGDNIVTTDNAGNAVIKGVADELIRRYPVLMQFNGDWSGVTNSTIRGTITVDSVLRNYDAIGIFDLKWTVVVVSTESDFFTPQRDVSENCITKTSCREVILEAAKDLRHRTLLQFREQTNNYLSAAPGALNVMDNAYNLGNLAEAWCDPCGPLSWSNAAEKNNLRLQTRNTLSVFPELSWVYLGMEGTPKTLMGFRRENNVLEMWKSCTAGDTCGATTTGTAFYNGEDEASAVRTPLPSDNPWGRNWYTTPETIKLPLYQYHWIRPYVFATGELGITAVRKAFGGDFKTTGYMGVWGADFTLSFLETFLEAFGVVTGKVLYIMDYEGDLLGSNVKVPYSKEVNNVKQLLKATEVENEIIAQSANTVMLMKTTLSFDTVVSRLWDRPTDTYFIDAIRIRDTVAANSYDWIFVMVTPESSLYDINFPDDSDGIKGYVIAIIVVCTVFVIVIFVAVVMFIKGVGPFARPSLGAPDGPVEAEMSPTPEVGTV
eukprot:TRINITY_DN24217_c0_g1_i1.p1 TRINITY_DN24217_c0_g1~~TRINITY_DN24217_c0_g1_i1.p1  ORF type:complete len:763 (+),score=185.77 TRINITY_DN24217_c0_g1_i1:40-2328(+)